MWIEKEFGIWDIWQDVKNEAKNEFSNKSDWYAVDKLFKNNEFSWESYEKGLSAVGYQELKEFYHEQIEIVDVVIEEETNEAVANEQREAEYKRMFEMINEFNLWSFWWLVKMQTDVTS